MNKQNETITMLNTNIKKTKIKAQIKTGHNLLGLSLLSISLMDLTACQTTPTAQSTTYISAINTSTDDDTHYQPYQPKSEPYSQYNPYQQQEITSTPKPASVSNSVNNPSNTQIKTTPDFKTAPVDPINKIDAQPAHKNPKPLESSNQATQPKKNIPDVFIFQTPQQQQNAEQQRQAELLERARQNSSAKASTNATTITPAAYNQLIKQGTQQLRNNQLGEAEATFTRAQRLAPKASTAYFYLGQVALNKNQPAKAEAMARRGLLVASSKENKRGLWMVILKSAQMRQNDQLIQEAKRALR